MSGESLNQVLHRLGYRTRPSRFMGRKNIICEADGEVVLEAASAEEAWRWLYSGGAQSPARNHQQSTLTQALSKDGA